MNRQISWYVELLVKAGALDRFRQLTEHMVESARLEPGTLIYERSISEDWQSVHVYERYEDSTAALAHLKAFQSAYAAQFATMVERVRFVVFGTPSEELRALLRTFGASFVSPLAGFSLCSRI